jgi:hypothetical protein
VNRALNFSGAQLSKVKGVVSASSENGAKQKICDGGLAQSQQSGKSGAGSKKLPPEVSNALSISMKRVLVQEDAHVPIRVSGLDFFAEFSEQSASGACQGKGEEVAEPRSLLDRLQAAKLAQFKLSTNRKSGFNGPSLSREISKHKKSKLNPKSGLGEQMHTAEEGGQDMEGVVASGCPSRVYHGILQEETHMKEGGGAHAAYSLAPGHPDNLTGAHGEPRQEQ